MRNVDVISHLAQTDI